MPSVNEAVPVRCYGGLGRYLARAGLIPIGPVNVLGVRVIAQIGLNRSEDDRRTASDMRSGWPDVLNRKPAGTVSMAVEDGRMTADLTDRLAEAADVPVLLAVAYDVFEHMLRALRGAEDQAGVLLPAFVLAAAAAGDGRDAVARAPWLPSLPEPAGSPMPAGGAEQVADETAALSRALWERLAAADAPAVYHEACAGGAEAAWRIVSLLTCQPL